MMGKLNKVEKGKIGLSETPLFRTLPASKNIFLFSLIHYMR